MIAKLALWLCLSLAVIAFAASLILAGFMQWQALKFSLALAAFFSAAAYLIKPSVEYYNEARENDRMWRDLYKF